MRFVGRALVCVLFVVAAEPGALFGQAQRALPNRPGSVKFAAIGDNGTGEQPQYETADQMTRLHKVFPFDLVIMLGDNMYGGQQPADFVKKFEMPYAALLSAGVKFQASLGNHDRDENVLYKPFNMNGQRYYSYARNNVRFFALDSTRMDDKQLACRHVAGAGDRGLEDLLFPSSAVLERGSAWRLGGLARAPRADPRQARGRPRVLRS
jgi:hypothetical protein